MLKREEMERVIKQGGSVSVKVGGSYRIVSRIEDLPGYADLAGENPEMVKEALAIVESKIKELKEEETKLKDAMKKIAAG